MISGRLTIVDDPVDIAASRFPMADTKYQRSNAANDSNEHDDRDNDGRRQAGAYTTSQRIEFMHLALTPFLIF
jgi:hypothetical protein